MISRRQFVKQVSVGALAGSGISAVGAHVAAAAPMDDARKSCRSQVNSGMLRLLLQRGPSARCDDA